MAEIKTGGSAFPSEQGHIPDGTWNQTYEAGMSLRDWFAGQALAGVMRLAIESARSGRSIDAALIAVGAYEQADAMLAEREKSDDAR